jgi:hypothetical protein
MQDVMDEQEQVLFDNLAWFAKKLCSVMTSTSECEHMWSIEGWTHKQVQEQIGTTKCGKNSSCPWQHRPQEGYVDIQTAESRMGLHTRISEPDRLTNEQGVDDSDDDDIDSDTSTERQDQHWLIE